MIPEATNHLHDIGSGISKPQVFECSDGTDRVLKMLPFCTVSSLASDWIGSLLAVHCEVLTPAPGLVNLGADAIRSMPPQLAARANPGLAYASVYIAESTTVTGLSSLIACRNHRELLSRLVPLDTWVQTADRMQPEFGRNLLIDNEDIDPRLLAIDFGLCFDEALFVMLGGPSKASIQTVCRDEVRYLLDPIEMRETLDLIEATSDAEIIKLVKTTPVEWLGEEGQGKVIRYLLERRALVRRALGLELRLEL